MQTDNFPHSKNEMEIIKYLASYIKMCKSFVESYSQTSDLKRLKYFISVNYKV